MSIETIELQMDCYLKPTWYEPRVGWYSFGAGNDFSHFARCFNADDIIMKKATNLHHNKLKQFHRTQRKGQWCGNINLYGIVSARAPSVVQNE